MTDERRDAESEPSVVRSEEQLHVGTMVQDAGRVMLRKLVGSRRDTEDVERHVEEVDMQTEPAEPGDTGEVITLPDGSLSVPVFEEQIVVEKRLVVRERVILRKYSVAHREKVEADVRVEHVEVVAEPSVADRVDAAPGAEELVQDRAGARAPEPEAEAAKASDPPDGRARAASRKRRTASDSPRKPRASKP
jgi:uncharacterized protein (TIGR02271 family)